MRNSANVSLDSKDEITAISESMIGRVIDDVRIAQLEGEMHIALAGGRVIVIIGQFVVGSCVPERNLH